MSGSILLRLVDGLKRVGDHASKHLMQKLRGGQAHTNTRFGLGYPIGVRIENRGRKAKVDNAVYASRLRDQVNECGGLSGVSYLPLLGAGHECATGFNHDLVSHQRSPLGKDYLVNLTAKPAGVESRPTQEEATA